MAKPAVTLIVFALCSLGALSQSDNATVVDEDDINNSSISLTPNVVTGVTPSTLAKLTNEEEHYSTGVNETNPTVTANDDRPEDPPRQPLSSTFPPLVHETPQANVPPTQSPTTMTQEIAKPTLAAAPPTKDDKPLQNAESNLLSDVKPTPTKSSSSNSLASNSLLFLSIVLMWKCCYY